ncbi:hypothetical protein D3C76_1796420 [compost metagenome]
MVVQGFFQLQVDQGQERDHPQRQVEQAIDAQGATLPKFQAIGQRVPQQQGQWQQARQDVTG